MQGLFVSVPVACWRKGHAREYLETEVLPPPSTCYGFLLSLIGEEDRERHVGTKVTCGIVAEGAVSVVLRTLWRIKDLKAPPGTSNNLRPDFQQVMTASSLNVWVDSSDEKYGGPTLEQRVLEAMQHPERVERFGGLSMGESTHLVDEVSLIDDTPKPARTFVTASEGELALPVWVDHVGSAGTRRVVGSLVELSKPSAAEMPTIAPHPSP